MIKMKILTVAIAVTLGIISLSAGSRSVDMGLTSEDGFSSQNAIAVGTVFRQWRRWPTYWWRRRALWQWQW